VACIRDCIPPFDLSLLLLRSTSTSSVIWSAPHIHATSEFFFRQSKPSNE
jgi:hypothetical protein